MEPTIAKRRNSMSLGRPACRLFDLRAEPMMMAPLACKSVPMARANEKAF